MKEIRLSTVKAETRGDTAAAGKALVLYGRPIVYDEATSINDLAGSYTEIIKAGALDGADLSDVIMQFDHSGMVFARNKMAKNKPPSLLLEPQESGLFIAANLSLTEEAKRLYASIDAGLICKMSWAFTVSEDAYNKDTHTRTILKIKKVYDVSAVSYPANADTDISARSYFDGVIEAEKREALARKAQILKIKLMMEV